MVTKKTLPVLAVIPARYDSTRLPGKPLADVAGFPLVVRVAALAQACKLIDRVIVATDDKRIFLAVQAAGYEARMTSSTHVNGSERVTEVADSLPEFEIVLNLQGDCLGLDAASLTALIDPLQHQNDIAISTLGTVLISKEERENPNVVKALVDRRGKALTFTRSYENASRLCHSLPEHSLLRHLGAYGYHRKALFDYLKLPVSENEQRESLEQLRALDAGFGIQVSTIDGSGIIDVNTPEDLEQARRLYAN